MVNRVQRFGQAFWVELIKRLPYIGFILLLIVLFQGYKTGAQVADSVEIAKRNSETNARLLEKIHEISETNKILSEDNKRLSEQSNRLAEQSIRYQDCIARTFAQYTRDYKPVVFKDLETCVTSNTEAIVQSQQRPQTTPRSTPRTTPQTFAPQPEPESPGRSNVFERLMQAPRGLIKRLQSVL